MYSFIFVFLKQHLSISVCEVQDQILQQLSLSHCPKGFPSSNWGSHWNWIWRRFDLQVSCFAFGAYNLPFYHASFLKFLCFYLLRFLYGEQARFFNDEIHQNLKHDKVGVVAMASAGENLNASQVMSQVLCMKNVYLSIQKPFKAGLSRLFAHNGGVC